MTLPRPVLGMPPDARGRARTSATPGKFRTPPASPVGEERVRGFSSEVLHLVPKVADYVLQGDDDLVPLGDLLSQTQQSWCELEPLGSRWRLSNHSQRSDEDLQRGRQRAPVRDQLDGEVEVDVVSVAQDKRVQRWIAGPLKLCEPPATD